MSLSDDTPAPRAVSAEFSSHSAARPPGAVCSAPCQLPLPRPWQMAQRPRAFVWTCEAIGAAPGGSRPPCVHPAHQLVHLWALAGLDRWRRLVGAVPEAGGAPCAVLSVGATVLSGQLLVLEDPVPAPLPLPPSCKVGVHEAGAGLCILPPLRMLPWPQGSEVAISLPVSSFLGPSPGACTEAVPVCLQVVSRGLGLR